MQSPAGLQESDLAHLVDRFYEKVRADALLGPVFNVAVHDWPGHKHLLTSFWSSVVLRTGTFRGNPMAAHRALPGIRGEHFDRWLSLWRETTAQTLDPEGAALMQDFAERIGLNLRLGMGLPAPGAGRGIFAVRDAD